MKRKRLYTLFTVLMLLFGLGSCISNPRSASHNVPTSKAPDSSAEIISFACHDYQRDHYASLAKSFQGRNPGIEVRLVSQEEVVPEGTDVVTKLPSAADTFIEYTILFDGREAGGLLDLADLAHADKEFTLDSYYPSTLPAFQSGGKLWGLPANVQTFVIYYNPALFDMAGVPYPQVGWTWDEFLEKAQKLTIREGGVVKQWGYVDSWASYILPTFVMQRVENLLDTSQIPPAPRLDQPRVAEAIQWYADLALVHGVMPNLTTMEPQILQQLPYEQSPAMWVGGSWEAANFRARCKAGLAPLPESDSASAMVNGCGYYVSRGTQHPQAAWKWIKFLSEQPPDARLGDIPAYKRAEKSWDAFDAQTAAVYRYNLEHAVFVPAPVRAALTHAAFEPLLKGEPLEKVMSAAQADCATRLAQAAQEHGEASQVLVATPVSASTTTALVRFQVRAGDDLASWRALAARFAEEHPEIQIDFVRTSSLDLAQAAQMADCFVGAIYMLQASGSTGLLPLDSLIERTGFGLEPYYSTILASAQVGGKLWALPLGADANFLYYHSGLFDAAHTPYPNGDWTPDQFVEQAIALTRITDGNPHYGFYLPSGTPVDGPEYLQWLGGKAFDAQGRPTFDDPSMVAALIGYAALIKRATPPDSVPQAEVFFDGIRSSTNDAYPTPIREGRVMMWLDRADAFSRAGALPFKVGVAPLPAGARSLSNIWPWGLFISTTAANPEACWEWVRFLSTQPEAVAGLAVRRDLAEGPVWRKQVGEAVAEVWLALVARGEVPLAPSQGEVSRSAAYWLHGAVADVLAGGFPATALAAAQKKASIYSVCLASRQGLTQEEMRTCAKQADPDVRMMSP